MASGRSKKGIQLKEKLAEQMNNAKRREKRPLRSAVDQM
jgi:hypothetical protein